MEVILNPYQMLTGVKLNDEEIFPLEADLAFYESSNCGGSLSRYKSIKKPNGYGLPPKKGQFLTEYEYFYDKFGSKIIRLYPNEEYLEIEWIFLK